ncbi:MAG TPA: GtrA family protein [Gammaproteobacteria bacterium]|nr:GtrA family protein [Gammaproteobacteria bacterium]
MVLIILQRNLIAELSRYGAVGLTGTAAHYLIMAGLLYFSVSSVVFATSIGAIFGAFINYILNYFYTFKCSKKHRETIIKYWLTAAFGAGINTGIMALNKYILNFNVIPAQLTATAVVFIITFWINRQWAF